MHISKISDLFMRTKIIINLWNDIIARPVRFY